MYTLENCEKLWNEIGRHGSIDERIECTKRWEQYYAYLAEKALSTPTTEIIPDPPVVDWLVKEGILTQDSTVLDIGAGMGSYALPLAKVCREVSALEPVGACLDVLQHKAEQHDLKNIHCIHEFWECFSAEKIYDVTFSSMCPAICNAEELRRMESITGSTCCLVAVQRGSYDKHRKAMMAGLQIKPQGGMTTEAIHYINVLYLMGRQPNVKFFEVRKTSRVSAETILEQYPIYFEIFGIEKETSIAFLERYLAEHAVDGFLEDESYLRQALIYWKKV